MKTTTTISEGLQVLEEEEEEEEEGEGSYRRI